MVPWVYLIVNEGGQRSVVSRSIELETNFGFDLLRGVDDSKQIEKY